jgi:hypothetical protein
VLALVLVLVVVVLVVVAVPVLVLVLVVLVLELLVLELTGAVPVRDVRYQLAGGSPRQVPTVTAAELSATAND